MYMTGAGLAVIALLVSYEVEMGKICQFCTMAHLSNVMALFGFWRATQLHDKGEWKDDAEPPKVEKK